MTELPLVMTVEETAKALRISRGAAYAAVRCGEIPHVRLGHAIRIPRHGLLSLLNANDPTANGIVGKKPEATGHVSC